MKRYKRILASVFSLFGIVFMLFPVTGGEVNHTAIQLLSLWKNENIQLAIWMICTITAMALITVMLSYGREKSSLVTAMVVSIISIGSLLAIPCVYYDQIRMPGWGDLCAVIFMFLSLVMACSELFMKSGYQNVTDDLAELFQDIHAESPKEVSEDIAEEILEEVYENIPEVIVEEMDIEAEDKGASASMAKGVLYIFCGQFSSSSIPIPHMETITLGRDAACCNLVINDVSLSRKHCTITYNAVNNTYLLLDLSSNGTYLEGGQRIPRNYAMEVQPGLRFYLGKPENKFRLG